MRLASYIALLALALSSPHFALAGGDKTQDKGKEPTENPHTLGAKAIQETLTPYSDKILDCYIKHGLPQRKANGKLALELIIHRNGSVFSLKIRAPGVKGKKLAKCIESMSKGWMFPRRKGFTHAVVPFFFLKTKGPGSKPMMSCWSAKGCHKRIRQARKQKQKQKQEKGK